MLFLLCPLATSAITPFSLPATIEPSLMVSVQSPRDDRVHYFLGTPRVLRGLTTTVVTSLANHAELWNKVLHRGAALGDVLQTALDVASNEMQARASPDRRGTETFLGVCIDVLEFLDAITYAVL